MSGTFLVFSIVLIWLVASVRILIIVIFHHILIRAQERAQEAWAFVDISQAMRGLFAVVENYPALKASTNFLALQDQFEGTENRISAARQRYNEAVGGSTPRWTGFPARWWPRCSASPRWASSKRGPML